MIDIKTGTIILFCRYQVRGTLLYVDHVDETAEGMYHCVIVRPDGFTETGDAMLGKTLQLSYSYHTTPSC